MAGEEDCGGGSIRVGLLGGGYRGGGPRREGRKPRARERPCLRPGGVAVDGGVVAVSLKNRYGYMRDTGGCGHRQHDAPASRGFRPAALVVGLGYHGARKKSFPQHQGTGSGGLVLVASRISRKHHDSLNSHPFQVPTRGVRVCALWYVITPCAVIGQDTVKFNLHFLARFPILRTLLGEFSQYLLEEKLGIFDRGRGRGRSY